MRKTFYFRCGNQTFRADPFAPAGVDYYTVAEVRAVVLMTGTRHDTVRTQPTLRVAADGSLRDGSSLLPWRPFQEA